MGLDDSKNLYFVPKEPPEQKKKAVKREEKRDAP